MKPYAVYKQLLGREVGAGLWGKSRWRPGSHRPECQAEALGLDPEGSSWKDLRRTRLDRGSVLGMLL